jgi:hypothetical protein
MPRPRQPIFGVLHIMRVLSDDSKERGIYLVARKAVSSTKTSLFEYRSATATSSLYTEYFALGVLGIGVFRVRC